MFAASKNRIDIFKELQNETGQEAFLDLISQSDSDGYTGILFIKIHLFLKVSKINVKFIYIKFFILNYLMLNNKLCSSSPCIEQWQRGDRGVADDGGRSSGGADGGRVDAFAFGFAVESSRSRCFVTRIRGRQGFLQFLDDFLYTPIFLHTIFAPF